MAKTDGENVANYDNPDYNRLFDKMQNMENSPERLAIIREMKEILQRDAPWIFTYHPVSFGLYHEWLKNGKPNDMANNTLKYQRVDGQLRAQRRATWNKPVLAARFGGRWVAYHRHDSSGHNDVETGTWCWVVKCLQPLFLEMSRFIEWLNRTHPAFGHPSTERNWRNGGLGKWGFDSYAPIPQHPITCLSLLGRGKRRAAAG